jgi:hypothetical protein
VLKPCDNPTKFGNELVRDPVRGEKVLKLLLASNSKKE